MTQPDIEGSMTRKSTTHDVRLARYDTVFLELYESVRRQAVRHGSLDADDVAAEVFAALWRHLDTVSPGAERAWAYAAVRLQTANQRRAARRRERLAEAVGALPEHEPDWTGGSLATDPHVRDTLACLSPADQELLLLATWSDATPSEIARILDVSRTAAAVRLHRAKRRFRAAYLATAPATGATPCIPTGGIDVQ